MTPGRGLRWSLGGPRRALGLLQLRGPDEVQHGLTISSALRWPDRNHILVGFSDLKIGSYQLEPFTKLALWTHAVDEASLTESQKFILRVQGSPLHLAVSQTDGTSSAGPSTAETDPWPCHC